MRSRLVYFLLIAITVVIGLSSRMYGTYFPQFLSDYLGDTLWTAMVYFLICFVFNKISIKKAAMAAFVFSYLIEVSKLYQVNWINQIRSVWHIGEVAAFTNVPTG